jgi:hypothetical protein
MAKRKSTALFEVIHSSQRSGSGGALSTPRWWFKSKARANAAAAEPAGASAAVNREPLLPRSSIQFEFDRERQEIALRLRYTTAIVGAFAALMIVALAYAVGRHIAGGPSPAYAAATSESLLRQSPDPSAMDVSPRVAAPGASGATTPASASQQPSSVSKSPAPAANGVEVNAQRSVGLNYIIVQSYPNEKIADEARDFLIGSGIPCTVEKGPKDWASDPSWCSVITTAGYAHIHSPEYETAARTITTLGETFAAKAKFKRFDPHAYKWKQA